jgi:hypothetical protein
MAMSRKTIDMVVSSAGLLIAVVLLAAGGLMVWGHVYIDHQVHNQLASQKIFFPPKGSPAIAGPQFVAMQKYAGQQLTTGAQAQTYANHFIAIHLSEVAGGKTYAQVSSAALADPTNTALKTQEATLFQGTTLRGLLLNAYAFGTVATIAGIGAIVSFVGAAVLLVLSGLGLAHARAAVRRVQAPAIATERPREAAAV